MNDNKKNSKDVDIPLRLTARKTTVPDRELGSGEYLSDEKKNMEMQEWLAIKDYYLELEDNVDVPSDIMFQRISEKISEQDTIGKLVSYLNVFRYLARSLWFPWALVFAQAVIIIYFVLPFNQPKYATLSFSRGNQESVVYMNIIFDDQAREVDIRRLLTSIGAEIVDGPEPNGLYVIRVPGSNSDFSSLEKSLKAKKIVRFLAPRY